MRSVKKRSLSLLLVLILIFGLLPGTAWAGEESAGGSIVMSFEMYDPSDGTVALLHGPEKVTFQAGDTGLSLAKTLLGDANVDVSDSGWVTGFTIDGQKYTVADMGANGSWSLYRNNAEDSVTISQYHPADGDVYRVILTQYDSVTYKFPVMPNDLDGLYWAMAEYTGEADPLQQANTLVQSAAPQQTDIDTMTQALSNQGVAHRILIDRRTVQVDTTKNPYTYINTLSANLTSAVQGTTVTVSVVAPGGMDLIGGALTASGVELSTTETAGQHTFVMPDHPVVLTAEFEENDSGKLQSAVFSYDQEQNQVISLSPAFNKNITEYALTAYDYELKNSEKLYSNLIFDGTNGTKAAWQYYMFYSGSGFYTPGPKSVSGVVNEHSTTNVMYPGMTNGYQHRVDITPEGGVAKSYYFRMTMLPTLSAFTVNGLPVKDFAGNSLTYRMVVPDETQSIVLHAVPYDEDSYGVYFNGDKSKDVSGKDITAALDQDGTTEISITVDDDCGTTSTYVLTVKTEAAVAKEKLERLDRMHALMESIASTYVESYSDWVVMDMAAYESYNSNTAHKTSAAAKQSCINVAVTTLATGKTPGGSVAGDTTYDKIILAAQSMGVDPRSLYPVNGNTALDAVSLLNNTTRITGAWNAPYTLAAYHQGSYGTHDYEKVLTDAVLASQDKGNGMWTEYGDSIQTTANMVAGLAFEYYSNDTVRTAIDQAVTYLSSQQLADGTFDAYGTGADSNTSAMVVVALASVGIDPATDTRFIKNGNSALDGLLCFALTDHSGFGYSDNKTRNDYATEQSFRALIAAAQVMKTGEAYNVYDFSQNTVESARATGSGTVVKPSEPVTNDTISVYITLKSDVDYWISKTAVTVKKGSTVCHAFTTLLDSVGITYVGAEDGYVSSITKGSKTLGQFTNGENSGWLYKVNGTVPDAGLTSYVIHSGDDIVWYFTNDWTKDSGVGTYQTTQKAKVTENKNGTYAVSLPANSSGPALVTLPGAKEGQVVVIVHADGTQEVVRKSLIQDGSAYLLLETDATVKLVDYVSSFQDVDSGAWYASAVDFVASRGLFSGMSENSFAPEATLNRGELVTVLYALEQPGTQTGEKRFSDVNTGAWYAQSTTWAVEAGIISGYGNGQFGPEDPVTREQLALMLHQYANGLNVGTSRRGSLTRFPDSGDVSSWAVEAVTWAVDAGILSGRTDGTLDPSGPATRAEMAAMLRQFVAFLL